MSFRDELDVMSSDIEDTFGVLITYRANSVGPINSATMMRATATLTADMAAVRGPGSVTYDSGFKEEEVTYSVLKATFDAAGTGLTGIGALAAADDQIVDGSATRKVIRKAVTVDEKWYEFTTRRRL